MKIVKVPVLDTGIGREAGYRDDAELMAAWEDERAELERLASPELLARLDAAAEMFVLGNGTGRPAYEPDDRREWTIRVCACGCPLGATMVAIRVLKCPDCGRPTVPVEEVTERVVVYAD